MAAFLGSIAFLFSVALLAWGLLVLSKRRAEEEILPTVAAIVLIVGGICGIVCNSWFYAKYYFNDQLDHAYPVYAMKAGMGMPGGGMGHGMPMRGMANPMDPAVRHQMMMNMMMRDPEMMQMMHEMMHSRGMVTDDDMPMNDHDMPMDDQGSED